MYLFPLYTQLRLIISKLRFQHERQRVITRETLHLIRSFSSESCLPQLIVVSDIDTRRAVLKMRHEVDVDVTFCFHVFRVALL